MLSTTACIITQHSFVWSGLGPDLGRAGLAGLVWSGLVWAGSGLLGRGLGAGWSLLGLDCLLQIDLKANFDMVVGGGAGWDWTASSKLVEVLGEGEGWGWLGLKGRGQAGPGSSEVVLGLIWARLGLEG
ncbi:hypothetical protein PPACK8108_LOCUS24817 [Phakopsora pachyrhizi]|uniref:Uncharacterized protein n=1 Tax=Phakopsora pachyrhizi TaxID=170000 RepID=A0AAV0BTE9_PHAPC|nr:hypothetical protein PPACK8108_LOCUS24817 [Phakopsora pachyrhizi]